MFRIRTLTRPGTLQTRRLTLAVLGFVLGFASAAPARADAAYNFIDLGTLGGSTSFAFGINDSGQVVGSSTLSSGQGQRELWRE